MRSNTTRCLVASCIPLVCLLQCGLLFGWFAQPTLATIFSDIRYHLSVTSFPWPTRAKSRFLTTTPMVFMKETDTLVLVVEVSRGDEYIPSHATVWFDVLDKCSNNTTHLRSAQATHSLQGVWGSGHATHVSTAVLSADTWQGNGAIPACVMVRARVHFQRQEIDRTAWERVHTPFHKTDLLMAVISDTQSGAPTFRRLLHTLRETAAPDVLVHIGDTTQNGSDHREAYMYFQAPLLDYFHAIGHSVPIVLVEGNHDSADRYAAYMNSTRAPTVVSFDAVNVLILNSENKGPEQVAYVRDYCAKRVAAKSSKLNLALIHIPPFVEYWEETAWTQKNESQWSDYSRYHILPALSSCAAAEPTLLVGGHSHVYQRGSDPDTSVALAVVGGGGGTLEDAEELGGRRESTGRYSVTAVEHHMVLFHIRKNRDENGFAAHWSAITPEGKLIDSWTLRSNQGLH